MRFNYSNAYGMPSGGWFRRGDRGFGPFGTAGRTGSRRRGRGGWLGDERLGRALWIWQRCYLVMGFGRSRRGGVGEEVVACLVCGRVGFVLVSQGFSFCLVYEGWKDGRISYHIWACELSA